MNELQRTPEQDEENITRFEKFIFRVQLGSKKIPPHHLTSLVKRGTCIEETIKILFGIIEGTNLLFGRDIAECQAILKEEGIQALWDTIGDRVPGWVMECLRCNSFRPALYYVARFTDEDKISYLNDNQD